MQMAQISSYSDTTTVFELAEHFQPKFKKFYKRDPFDVFDFIMWGLHEECNLAAMKKHRILNNLNQLDGNLLSTLNFHNLLPQLNVITIEPEEVKNDSHVLDNFEGELYIEMKCYE
jgi:hypothetical protein